MRYWSSRPFEERNLFNPAFCAVVLAAAIREYERVSEKPMPYSDASASTRSEQGQSSRCQRILRTTCSLGSQVSTGPVVSRPHASFAFP